MTRLPFAWALVFASLARAHAATGRMRDELLVVAQTHARRQADEAAEHSQTRASLDGVQAALARRNADVKQLEESVAAYRTENARLDAALAAQDRIIGYRQSLRWWLRLPLVRVKLWWHRLTQA